MLLVTDMNTYAACGDEIKAQSGGKLENMLIYERDGLAILKEKAGTGMSAFV